MTGIEDTRGEPRRIRPGPEVVAVLFAAVLYGVLLVIGMSSTASERPTTSQPPAAVATTSPRPSADPLRQDILGLLEIDERLIANRATLRTLLKERRFDAGATATVLRAVGQTATLGSDRASRLALDETANSVGAHLEIIYASADRTVQDALDASITTNVEAYQVAAQSIVDLFVDLPTIDRQLQALLGGPAASPSIAPSASASASPPPSPSPSPSAPASPTARASASTSPGPSGKVVDPQGEMLRDRSFEQGPAQWEVVADPPAIIKAATDKPLVGTGSASLRLDLSVPSDPAASARIGQVVSLAAGERYVAKVMMRASSPRSVRIRVVGPNEELHAVQTVDIGQEAAAVSVPLTALIDDPGAHLWIEFPGAWSGSVWLDDASMSVDPGP